MRRLEDRLRSVQQLDHGYVVVRGSQNTVAKLMHSAQTLASQYTWNSEPAHGISVNVVADLNELHALLRTPAYRTRHHVRRGPVAQVAAAGFTLLASFAEPTHYTALLEPYTEQRARQFLDALTTEEPNPYFTGRRPR